MQPPSNAAPIIELVIRHLPNGQIQVTGPIQNKALCYGLLELAKDVIRQVEAGNVPSVQIAKNLPNNGGR
jgi:hypothetical protein